MSETTTPSPAATTTHWQTEITHSRDEGIAVLPIAGPPPQIASAVRIHAPIEFMSVYWSAVRSGAPPVLPSWKSFLSDPNRIFLGGMRTADVPISLVAGHSFACAGVYHFAILSPFGLDSDFKLGIQPWEKSVLTPFDNFIPAQNFAIDLLCPTTPIRSGSGVLRSPSQGG